MTETRLCLRLQFNNNKTEGPSSKFPMSQPVPMKWRFHQSEVLISPWSVHGEEVTYHVGGESKRALLSLLAPVGDNLHAQRLLANLLSSRHRAVHHGDTRGALQPALLLRVVGGAGKHAGDVAGFGVGAQLLPDTREVILDVLVVLLDIFL